MLAPEDMVNPHVDDLSMMTYLSRFPDAKLKPGAPISKKRLKKGDASKVQVSGPGLKPTGLDTNVPAAQFTVDPRGAGDGKITATVQSPDGPIECKLEPKRDGTTKCSYVPTAEGDYEVEVKFNGLHVGESPYKVFVAHGVDPSACHAYGPGVEGGDIRCESPTEFWVETAGAGDGELGIIVRGPKGPLLRREVDVSKVEDSDDKYHVDYTPQQPGPHTVEVTYSGLHIKDSPFRVQVKADRPDASKCSAEGPGIEETGGEINAETWFDVHTLGAGKGELIVNVKGPHGTADVKRENKDKGLDHFTYTPTESGEHVITVKYGGEHIPGSRFKVVVEPPTDASKCTAFGPGLAPQGVRVNDPAKFTVRTKDAGYGDVDVKITGPTGEVPCQVESSPYTFNYSYQATEPGDYSVDITFAGEHIPDSPYPVAITDAGKVTVIGPGMDGECLPVDVPLVYTVDARGAGPGNVKSVVQDRGSVSKPDMDQTDYADAPVVTANGDGTFKVEYTPTKPGLKKMNLTFGEAPIPNTPLKLSVFDASKVMASGPGLEDGNKSGEMTNFTVDMRAAGEGKLDVSIDGPVDTPVTIKDQANSVVKCEYTPTVPGDYVVNVKYEGMDVPNCPRTVTICPSIDASLVKVYGPGLGQEDPGLTTDMWAEFFVDYKEAGDGEPQVTINGPGGGEKYEEEQVKDGLRKYRYYIEPDEAGDYKIDIKFADEPIPKSPYDVHINWKTDPNRVKVFGPGIEGGFVKEWTEFTVDMSEAGEGGLNLQIEGPCEAQVSVEDHEDGTATVKYYPEEAGEYHIHILFADTVVPGAPFTPLFVPETDASKVKAHGPGLKREGVKVGDLGDFVIDTREAGKGAVDVVIDGPYWHGSAPTPLSPLSPVPTEEPKDEDAARTRTKGSTNTKPKITSNNDDTYDVVYNPRKVGTYKINVFFADQAIPNSPYEVNVSDPSKVKVTGPGFTNEGDKLEDIPVISTSNHEPVEWRVDCTEAGPGVLDAVLYGQDGKQQPLTIAEDDEDVYVLKHQPETAGRHRLVMKYAGNELRESPVDISLFDSSQVKVTGAGLAGGRIGEEMVIDVDTSKAGEGGLALSLAGPAQAKMDCDDHHDGTATLRFTPEVPGEYKLDVKFGDEDVPGSIFSIPAIDPSKCKASGSGVTGEGAHVGAPATVIVDTTESGPAPIDVKVTDPSGEVSVVQLLPVESKPGVFSGDYQPKEPGNYTVEAKFADEAINGSPFSVPICDPSAVTLDGPGLASAIKDKPNVIDVFTANAGPGEVGAEMKSQNPRAPPVDVSVEKVADDHYQITYTPHDASDVEAQVTYGGVPVGDKRAIPVVDTAKVKLEGPGVEAGNLARQETSFTVDASEAGKGDLDLEITDPDGNPVDAEINEIEPQKWEVKYKPEAAGSHVIKVQYNDQEIPDSPLVVEVVDPEAVKVFGPGLERAVVNEETSFTVDAAKAGEGALGLSITGPADCVINVEDKDNGLYEVRMCVCMYVQ